MSKGKGTQEMKGKLDVKNLTTETAVGSRAHCENCESKKFDEWPFVYCQICTRKSLAYQAMCKTCADDMNRCCCCTKLLVVPASAQSEVATSVTDAPENTRAGAEISGDTGPTSVGEVAASETNEMDDPVKVLGKVRNACFFYNGLAKPDDLKLSDDMLPPLKQVLETSNRGDVPALQQALDSPELKAAGGLPKDILSWMPFPTWLDYDGEDGPLSQKYLGVVKALCKHGAAVTDEELLAACARFGLRGPPPIQSNVSLNRAVDWACQYGFVPVFRFLHERGANCKSLVGDACGEGHIGVLRYMLGAKLLPTPAESEQEGTAAHRMVVEAFLSADMSGRKRVLTFLVVEAGYDRKRFCDHGERHEPLD